MAHLARLILAYGKQVNSIEELQDHWLGGSDFKISGGPYCSVRDYRQLKSAYDVITLFGHNGKDSFEVCIFRNILAGLTTYI